MLVVPLVGLPCTEGPAVPMSGIITGAGGGAVVLVNKIPSPSIIAFKQEANQTHSTSDKRLRCGCNSLCLLSRCLMDFILMQSTVQSTVRNYSITYQQDPTKCG